MTETTKCDPDPNSYGRFSDDATEFRITNPRTPRPWVNVIANPRMGLIVSQTGSGFTWIDNSQLAVITRWQQDLAQDCSGKFLYARDSESGECWSLSPAPLWPRYSNYTCSHALGFTTFETSYAGVSARWTLFVHPTDTIELWSVELLNESSRHRRLELTAFLEWCCGVAPSPRREFHKLFIETQFDPALRAVFAQNHMWEVPSERFGHWNTDFPYISAFACTEPIQFAQGDMANFVGRYGSLRAPAALNESAWNASFGRHDDPIAALRTIVSLAPNGRAVLGFGLAVAPSRPDVESLLQQWLRTDAIPVVLESARQSWRTRLADHRIETPDSSINALTNDWTRYQAISARIWGRCGYYQQSGAYGFRDQLQDSQVWLTIDPDLCRKQINLHAAHQFSDGSVFHWWHPLSEQGLTTRMTDDLLWLAFVTANYLKETDRFEILDDLMPFVDNSHAHSLLDHIQRAFNHVFRRISPRGLPYIGAGDWNDGLSAVGLQERGESIWLAQFLVGLLDDWAEIHRRIGRPDWAADLESRRAKLIRAVNEHAWDGEWYIRATLDDGSPLGSRKNRVARIFLNAQTWAILNDVAPPDRAKQCWNAVREHLVTDAGALLLAPAFDAPIPEIGYITRYAPGLRENGGVYTHAAMWAIAAAAKMRDAELVGKLLHAVNPTNKNPENYWAEPYVLPGNVDGPDSPHFGRAGWTWYTGSAAWFHRVVTQYVLGVRPDWDGLHINPCFPPEWSSASMTRPWRGHSHHIRIERSTQPSENNTYEIFANGTRLLSNRITPSIPSS